MPDELGQFWCRFLYRPSSLEWQQLYALCFWCTLEQCIGIYTGDHESSCDIIFLASLFNALKVIILFFFTMAFAYITSRICG